MKEEYFITGAGGFIGRHLVNRMLDDGDSVHILIRNSSRRTLPDRWQPQVYVHIWNETTEGLIGIMNQVQPSVVIHAASLFIAEHTSSQVDALIGSNVLFGTQLLEAMAVAGVKKLINFGTSWQHFRNEPYNPVCLYAATKQAFEDIVTFYVEARGLRVITLKLFDTYGPDDDRKKLFSTLMHLLRTGESLSLSPGEQIVDFVHVDDVVEATLVVRQRLFANSNSKECFAISSGEPLPLRDLVAMVGDAAGKPLNIVWGGRPYRAREVMEPWTAFSTLPGWSPRISLKEGIRRMVSSHV